MDHTQLFVVTKGSLMLQHHCGEVQPPVFVLKCGRESGVSGLQEGGKMVAAGKEEK